MTAEIKGDISPVPCDHRPASRRARGRCSPQARTQLRLAHEIGVLAALAREPRVPFLPEIIASGTDPCS